MALDVQIAENSKLKDCDFDNLQFGTVFTDHMLSCDFDDGQWGSMKLQPLESLKMHPGSHVFHYGQAVFEGLKAYKLKNGELNLFRLKDNISRLNKSLHRLAMPQLNETDVYDAILKWIDLERKWVPNKSQGSLYIRPFVISTSRTLKAMPSASYKFMVIGCPVGFYYDHPIRVRLETNFTRAASGGVGYAKAAGNYAAAFMPAGMARQSDFDQVLWTDPTPEHNVEELGSANVFFIIDGILRTPAVKDSILDGITRDTVIQLAQEMGFECREETIPKKWLIEKLQAKQVQAIFATGTAAAITYITEIEVEGSLYHIESSRVEEINQIKSRMDRIKFAEEEESYSWNVIV